MSIKRCRDLKVWQKAVGHVVESYKLETHFLIARKLCYIMKSQLESVLTRLPSWAVCRPR
jgi:hypothetical protein